jgi:hypothetical protein
MKVSKTLRRLLWTYLLMLVGLTVIAALMGAASNGGLQAMGSSLGLLFFLGGLGWLVVAYFSGGSVSTYLAPIQNPSQSLLYTLPSKAELVLPSDSPEVMADLRDKMENQTGPMILEVLSFLGFFALALLFAYVPLLGYLALAAVLLTLGGFLALQHLGEDGRLRRGGSRARPPSR